MKHIDVLSAAPLLPLDLWLAGQELLRGIAPEVRAWLTEPRPLSERIRAASGARATLRVIGERLAFLSAEQQALVEAPAASCLAVEAELAVHGRPWVYVESLIPDHTLEQHPWLAELGDSPLAATLDGVAGLERGPFEFAPLPPGHPLAVRALARVAPPHAAVWARRAWLALAGRRLLVQEVFLPGLGRC